MKEISKLVTDALSGDKKALEELYIISRRSVYFTCLSFVKNETDAMDMTHDTYMTAFSKLSSLNEPESFETWVNRIAVNTCKNFLARRRDISLDDENSGVCNSLVDENFLPEEYVTDIEKRRVIMRIIRESLSEVQYRTVIMFYFNEMSVREIAQAMNCPEGTVKFRLNAARAKIKEGVLGYEEKNDERLHAVAGIPFLTRLLRAEAGSIDVPHINIDFDLPCGGAVSSGTAAKNLTSNAGKRMLGTLKAKVIAGAAAVVVVGGGIAAGVALSGNDAEEPDVREKPAAEKNTASFVESRAVETENTDVESVSWIGSKTWGEPSVSFEGGLFNDRVELPLDISTIDDISAPYCLYSPDFKDYEGYDVFTGYMNIDTIGEILSLDALINVTDKIRYDSYGVENGLGICTQTVGGDASASETFSNPDNIDTINIFNFNDTETLVGDCYRNGWWMVDTDEDALMLDYEDTEDDPFAVLDAVVEKFGNPTYLSSGGNSAEEFYSRAATEDDVLSLYYSLIYEYDDYTLIIEIKEFAMREYDTQEAEIIKVYYYNSDCWKYAEDRAGYVLFEPRTE